MFVRSDEFDPSFLGYLGGFMRGLLCTAGRAVLLCCHEPFWHGEKPRFRCSWPLLSVKFMNTIVSSSAWGLWSPSSPFCHSTSSSLVSGSACFDPTPRGKYQNINWKISKDVWLFAQRKLTDLWFYVSLQVIFPLNPISGQQQWFPSSSSLISTCHMILPPYLLAVVKKCLLD